MSVHTHLIKTTSVNDKCLNFCKFLYLIRGGNLPNKHSPTLGLLYYCLLLLSKSDQEGLNAAGGTLWIRQFGVGLVSSAIM